MKPVLMCPPTYFDIEYEINPWMHVENKVNREKVLSEYQTLKETYQKLGVEVLEIDPDPSLPDMVYTTNTGFPFGNSFIKSNFRFPQRRKEADLAKKYLENLGYKILTLPDNVYFEGEGDLLVAPGKYFMGFGKRSAREAADFISQMLGIKFATFELNDPYYYHLDMSLGPLDSNTALVNTRSFSKEGLFRLRGEFSNIIEVGDEDNKKMACNLIVVDNNVILAEGISDPLKKSINKAGYNVIEVPMGEYQKGGGSVKCITLEFF